MGVLQELEAQAGAVTIRDYDAFENLHLLPCQLINANLDLQLATIQGLTVKEGVPAYERLEREYRDGDARLALLAMARSLDSLKLAYPNYLYADAPLVRLLA